MEKTTLEQLRGLPARLTLLGQPAPSGHPAIRLHGIVQTVTVDSITIQLVSPIPQAFQNSALSVELLHPDGLLRFDTSCYGEYEGNHSISVIAPNAEQLHWVQRRNKIRASVRIPCSLRTSGYLSARRSMPALTQNLSAGGLAVESQTDAAAGDRLLLVFDAGHGLPDQPLTVEVLRVTPCDGGYNILALRFVGLDRQEEELLSRYVVEVQYRQRDARGHAAAGTQPT